MYITINDTEYQVGKNKVYIINRNIIFVKAIGEQTDDMAKAHISLNKHLVSITEGGINYLIDLNLAGKSTPLARRTWRKLGAPENSSKVGLFGMHPVARILASFVMEFSPHNNIHFFSDKRSALTWMLDSDKTE